MKVDIGRTELIALCRSIEFTGPPMNVGYEEHFERRPFVNGIHYRLKSSSLSSLSEEDLFKIYSTHSNTIKLL